MFRPLKSLSTYIGIFLLVLSPVLISGTSKHEVTVVAPVGAAVSIPAPAVKISNSNKLSAQATVLYDSMKLKRMGLSKKAFEFAWKGYQYMLSRNLLRKTEVLSICDFSQSSRRKRLYIIDLETMKLLINTHVAHGRNSGKEYAKSFSNTEESHKSSLGFYVTRNTYWGCHGLALEIDGLERGINDKANERKIVVHGSDYVGDRFLRSNPFNGRSFGCPAVPSIVTAKVINAIKKRILLFYLPSNKELYHQVQDIKRLEWTYNFRWFEGRKVSI